MIEYDSEKAEYLSLALGDVGLSGGIVPICAGRMMAKSNYSSGPKRILIYTIHFVISGYIRFIHNDHDILLTSGDVFCMYPHEQYHYLVGEDKPLPRMIWFDLNGAQTESVFRSLGMNEQHPYAKGLFDRSTENMLNELLQSFRNMQGTRETNEQDYFHLMSSMYQLLSKLRKRVEDTRDQTDGMSGWLQEALTYLDTHYTEESIVLEASRIAGVHRTYFSKVFKEVLGLSPRQYVTRLKMEKSAEMIIRASYSIAEIAGMVGYSDVYAFSKAFREYYRIPPNAYRKKQLAGHDRTPY